MQVIREEGLQRRAAEVGSYLLQKLQHLKEVSCQILSGSRSQSRCLDPG